MAGAALAALERERSQADTRALIQRRMEDGARARLESEQGLAETAKRKLLAEEAALRSAAERARLESEAAVVAQQRREDAARRTQVAGERRQLALARIGASWRRLSWPSAFAAAAFALGFAAAALWLNPSVQSGAELSRGRAAVQPATPAGPPTGQGALALRIDADHAAFAAHVAAKAAKRR